MGTQTNVVGVMAAVAGLAAGLLMAPGTVRAHCDTLDGPVVKTAQEALEKGDVTPVLKWVQNDQEGQIREAFSKTLAVRGKGSEARDLADMYFFETLVRLHRAGEGAPYTGLKPAGTDTGPAVKGADKALETGSVDPLVKMVTQEAAAGIRQRFAQAAEARMHMNDSVAAGRKFVEAYVTFVHYVEAVHDAVAGQAGHAHEAEAGRAGQRDEAQGGQHAEGHEAPAPAAHHSGPAATSHPAPATPHEHGASGAAHGTNGHEQMTRAAGPRRDMRGS
jgi:hypothetical protein